MDRLDKIDISPGQVELAIRAVQVDNIQFQVNIYSFIWMGWTSALARWSSPPGLFKLITFSSR
jgi:hypothetical protein